MTPDVSPARMRRVSGPPPLAVGVLDAARMLGLGLTSLYALFRTGDLVARKSGKRTLVLVVDLQRYLDDLPIATEGRKVGS